MKGLGRKRALQIIDGFPESRVLVIGDLMVDHFIWGSVSRISPEAPVPVVQVLKESRLLGGSANVLHNIVSIGGRAAVSGIVGDDESGQWMVDEFRKMGI
ncbi:MAG: PfkB family carbohydrate kinase, partial [Syntrophales bacterium]